MTLRSAYADRRPRQLAACALCALLIPSFVACSGAEAESTSGGTLQERFIVGSDDRLDVYAHPDAAWRTRAQNSTGALIGRASVDVSNPANVLIASSTLGPGYNLCSSERFLEQPVAAFCSGTLIDEDLVLTAGHCIEASGCLDTSFLFDFRMESATQRATVTASDVYNCSEVLVQRHDVDFDYAIFRLDRPVSAPLEPAPVADAKALALGEEVTVIGHPSGIPTKLADGLVTQPLYDGALAQFRSTADIFAGNSGSGVFDQAGKVVGILTDASAADYVSVGSCNVANRLPEGEAPAVSRYALWAVRELCNTTSVESAVCGSDSPVCGDNRCEPREQYLECPEDCPPLPPEEWTCSPSEYVGDIDGWCWCGCGAPDPDCAKPNHFMATCNFNESCGQADQCSSTHVIPGRLEAVKFVRAQENTSQNLGNCNTTSAVDMQTSSDVDGSRCNVGWTEAGEWLEYDVVAERSGEFDISLRLASDQASATVRVEVDGVRLGASLAVPRLGWQTFSTLSLPPLMLAQGAHTVRVVFETGGTNFTYLNFEGQPAPTGIPVPARIQESQYSRHFDSDALNNGASGSPQCNQGTDVDYWHNSDNGVSGCHLGWTVAGEWLEYEVSVAQAGTFDLSARLASALTGKQIRLHVDGSDLGVLTAPNLGWGVFQSRTIARVALAAGTHVIRLEQVTGDVDLNYLDVVASGASVPGRIEAEAYTRFLELTAQNLAASYAPAACNRGDGVDIEGATEGGCSIGWTSPGEWLEYDINVASAASYDLSLRMASANSGKTASVSIDGVNVGTLTAPSAGWQAFQDRTLSGLQLSAGAHVLRVSFDTNDVNLNYIELATRTALRVEAESYSQAWDNTADNLGPDNTGCDGAYGVDLEPTSDHGGVCNVGWADAGEWLSYSVNVPVAGTYTLRARTGSGVTAQYRIELDGADVSGTISTATGSWQSFEDKFVSNLYLSQGTHTFTLRVLVSGLNFNYFELTR